jgi:drug/metabolite transporter (DMT)-like permease
MLIWAGSGIAVKEALVVFTPLTLIVLRFTLAVILMLAIGLIFRQNNILGLQHMDRKDLPLFLLGGLFQPFLYFIFETYTYQSFASPTIAEAMLSTQPVLAPIFAFVLLRERVTRNNIIGILLSTIGMLMLLLMGNGDMGNGVLAIGNGKGVILAILTVSMSVSYSVILRRIPSRYSPLSIVFYVQSISLILFYIVWIVMGEAGALLHHTIPFYTTLHNTPQLLQSCLAVGYLAVFSSVAAFVLFCYTVRQIGVTRANIFNNVRPVFTAILMWIMFGEILPVWKLVGIAVIIIGLFISEKKVKNQP